MNEPTVVTAVIEAEGIDGLGGTKIDGVAVGDTSAVGLEPAPLPDA